MTINRRMLQWGAVVLAVAAAVALTLVFTTGSTAKEQWISAVKDAGFVGGEKVNGSVQSYADMYAAANMYCYDDATTAPRLVRQTFFPSAATTPTERRVEEIGSTPEQAVSAYVDATEEYVCAIR